MTTKDSDLDRGLQAAESHDYATAYEALRPLLDQEGASPEYLEQLAEVAWWVGHTDDARPAGEKAVAAYTAQGRKADAARVAVWVAELCVYKQQASLANGWIGRANRLLDGLDLDPALGHLRRLESRFAAGSEKDLEKAIALVAEAQEIGEKTGDQDLEMLGMHDRGRYLVYLGDVERGMAMMEDALVSVVAGELSPKVTGRILCNMIEVTSSTADYHRATEWSDQAMRWCESLGNAGGYPGVCRVRRSEFMRLRGAWPEAELEALRAADDLSDIAPHQAQAFDELGMIRLNTGDLEGAEEAFRRAHSLGMTPMPGLALLALGKGDAAGAWSMIETALLGTDAFLARAKLLPAAVEIALVADEVDLARVFAKELHEISERYESEFLRAFAVQAEGRIAIHESRFEDAVSPLEEVVAQLVAWGVPFEAAKARCDLGRALIEHGSSDLGWLEINEAKAEFARLGASAALADLNEMMASTAAPEARQTVATMMFTDIVDSTKLVGLIGDESWADLIGWHDRTIRGLLDSHGGQEIDHAGDGFFVSFQSAEAALDCAAEIQNVLRQHRKESGFSPRVRIGIHVGEVLQSDEGLVGHEVHSAARVASAAQGDEVLVSDTTASMLGHKYRFDMVREVEAKGVSEPIPVRALIWHD